jgi:hypothetical protein
MLDAMLNSMKKEVRGVLWGLIAVSIVIQISGVLISAPTYLKDLYIRQQIPDLGLTIWQVQHTPLIEHWRLLLSGIPPDLAAWRNYAINPTFVTLSALLNLGMVAAAAWALRKLWLPIRLALTRRHLLLGFSLTFFMLTISPVLMLHAFRGEPRYFSYRVDLTSASSMLSTEPRSGDVIVMDSYLSPAWYHFLNFGRPSVPWYSLPLRSQTSGRISTPTLFADLCQQFKRIWLFAETTSADPAAITPESFLAQNSFLINEWGWLLSAPNSTARLTLYQFNAECQTAR